MRIGLIGLGVMGAPMARNIACAGLPLAVYNRSPGPVRAFAGTNVAIAGSPAEVFEAADHIVLMLKDGAATDAILGREGDSFAVWVKGKTLINMATLAPNYSKRLSEAIAACGGVYLEAPVSGSRKPAEDGALVVMTAGPISALAEADPIFRAVGKQTIFCGDPPNAMAMKSASNVMLAQLMSGIVEAVNFAERSGLDLETFSKVILEGPMASDFVRMKLPRAIAKEYSPQAALHNVAYSLDVMLESADASGIAVPGARAMRASCEEALKMGHGEKDVLALIETLSALSKATTNR